MVKIGTYFFFDRKLLGSKWTAWHISPLGRDWWETPLFIHFIFWWPPEFWGQGRFTGLYNNQLDILHTWRSRDWLDGHCMCPRVHISTQATLEQSTHQNTDSAQSCSISVIVREQVFLNKPTCPVRSSCALKMTKYHFPWKMERRLCSKSVDRY